MHMTALGRRKPVAGGGRDFELEAQFFADRHVDAGSWAFPRLYTALIEGSN